MSCGNPHLIPPACEICIRGYTGDTCDDTFAQYFGSQYRDYGIVFIVLTTCIGIGAVVQCIRLVRAKGLLPLNVQKYVHLCILFGVLCSAARSADPLGWRLIYPLALIQVLIDTTSAALFSACIAVFFTWMRIIRILSIGILQRDGTLPSSSVSDHLSPKLGSAAARNDGSGVAGGSGGGNSSGSSTHFKRLFHHQVILQVVMWTILLISSYGQSMFSPSWVFRIIKLANFIVFLLILLISGWTVGVQIWRDLGRFQLNTHPTKHKEISRILKLLGVFTLISAGAIAEQLYAIADEAKHKYDINTNPPRVPSSLFAGPINADILQFAAMAFLLVFFRRIAASQRANVGGGGSEPLLTDDPYATAASDEQQPPYDYQARPPQQQQQQQQQPEAASEQPKAAHTRSGSRTGPNSGSLISAKRIVPSGSTPRTSNAAAAPSRAGAGIGGGRKISSGVDIQPNGGDDGSGGGGGGRSYARSARPRGVGSMRGMEGSLAEHYSLRSDALLTLISNSMEHSSNVPVPGTRDYAASAASGAAPNAIVATVGGANGGGGGMFDSVTSTATSGSAGFTTLPNQ